MITSTTEIRVRYAETDRMGYVYYGNYATYYEVARVECMKAVGVSYRSLEDAGIMLPVLDYRIKYYKPAYYDELLIVETVIPRMPQARIQFDYTVKNEAGDVLNQGSTTLVFVDIAQQKPVSIPEDVRKRLEPYFQD